MRILKHWNGYIETICTMLLPLNYDIIHVYKGLIFL